MNSLNLPNSITVLRLILVIPTTIFLIKDKYTLAVILFFVAAISDIADGFFARILNQKTKIGAILDPLADKFLINYTFLILSTKGLIPLLLFGVVLFKDIILISGSVVGVLTSKNCKFNIKASIWGKISTFLQVVVIVEVFFKIFNTYFNKTIFDITVYVCILLSVAALIDYTNKYLKREEL